MVPPDAALTTTTDRLPTGTEGLACLKNRNYRPFDAQLRTVSTRESRKTVNDTHTMSGTTEKPEPDLPATERSPRLRFILRPLLIGVIVICGLLAVLTPSLRYFRRLAQQEECMRNLKVIGLALHNYHDVYKKFPWAITYGMMARPCTAGAYESCRLSKPTPSMSATTSANRGTAQRIDCLGDEIPDTWQRQRWHAAYQSSVLSRSTYRCPSAPQSQNRMCTNYVMLIDDRPGKPNGPPNRPGSVPPSFDHKSAVIVIEIADSDIHWMEPRDVLLSELSMKINDRSKRSLSSYHGGACVAARGRLGGITG